MNKIYFTEVVLLTKSYNLQDFKDWLHWHLDVVGFDNAHIFDNESSVDIKTVCESYGDKVSYELVKGWPNQYALYNRYINNESPAWWVLPIDDDEFLYVGDTRPDATQMPAAASCYPLKFITSDFYENFTVEKANEFNFEDELYYCLYAKSKNLGGVITFYTFVNFMKELEDNSSVLSGKYFGNFVDGNPCNFRTSAIYEIVKKYFNI